MAKSTGLDTRLYVEGYDLSGDANSLGSAGWSQNLLDVTTLDSSAIKRIVGEASGQMTVNVWFDAASGKSHSVFTSLSGKQPTADQTVLVPMGSAVGSKSAGIVAKQADYSVDSAPGSAVSGVVNYSSTAGVPLEFGTMVTAHDDTITASTSGSSVDDSASTSNGGSWIYQILAFSAVGGNARWTANLQHSSDNSSFSDVISAHVTAVGAARGEFTGTLNRYVKNRVVLDASSGSITFAIGYVRD
jgi:hypothetical protein